MTQNHIREFRLEAVRLVSDDLEESLRVRRVHGVRVGQRLAEPLDGRHRRPQLVRHIGHEIPANPFKLPQPRDIMEHDHGPDSLPGRIAERHALGLEHQLG